MFNDKRILITGGTGTVGYALVQGLLKCYSPKEIIIFSRSEVNQVQMKAYFDNKALRFVIGDIVNEGLVNAICRDVDIIFHCAALKHVGICEKQPDEAFKNVIGAGNIINAALLNDVSKVINMSSDKAVYPNSIYGHTKAIAERLFVQANDAGSTQFINFRSGNIFASSGSVVPLLKNQCMYRNKVTITDGDMTRFFISKIDVAAHLMRLVEYGKGGCTYIQKDQIAFRLRDIAAAIVDLNGNSSTSIEEVGAGASEKKHEEIYTDNEKVYFLTDLTYETKEANLILHRSSRECTANIDEIKRWLLYDHTRC
jgi:UDP-N-acetylglucosamine 4,6-dehydratase/5-epimerase